MVGHVPLEHVILVRIQVPEQIINQYVLVYFKKTSMSHDFLLHGRTSTRTKGNLLFGIVGISTIYFFFYCLYAFVFGIIFWLAALLFPDQTIKTILFTVLFLAFILLIRPTLKSPFIASLIDDIVHYIFPLPLMYLSIEETGFVWYADKEKRKQKKFILRTDIQKILIKSIQYDRSKKTSIILVDPTDRPLIELHTEDADLPSLVSFFEHLAPVVCTDRHLNDIVYPPGSTQEYLQKRNTLINRFMIIFLSSVAVYIIVSLIIAVKNGDL